MSMHNSLKISLFRLSSYVPEVLAFRESHVLANILFAPRVLSPTSSFHSTSHRGANKTDSKRGNTSTSRKEGSSIGLTAELYRKTSASKNDHNVVIFGRVKPNTTLKVCHGCGSYLGELGRGGKGRHGKGEGTGAVAHTTRSSRPQRFHTLGDMTLCPRCTHLQQAGSSAMTDEDRQQALNQARKLIGQVDVAAFENQLHALKFKRVAVVLVVDATDPLGSLLPWDKLSSIVGTNPLFVVLTKCDLLPAVTPQMMQHWQELAMQHYGENVVKCFALSGSTTAGVFRLAKHMWRFIENGKNNVYIIGQANIGKSTLSRSLAECFFQHTFFSDVVGLKRRAGFLSRLPTVSALPGTTLMSLRVPCFDSPTHAVWDTPGLVPQPSPFQADRLMIQEPKPMRPDIFELKGGQSLVFGQPDKMAVLRLEVRNVSAAQSTETATVRLCLWQSVLNIDIPVRVMSTEMAEQEEHLALTSQPTSESEKTKWKGARSPLMPWKELAVTSALSSHKDIVIGGLGWISFASKRRSAYVKVFIPEAEEDSEIPVILRPAFYNPYMTFADIMELRNLNNEETDGVYEFTREAAMIQEERRDGIFFNQESSPAENINKGHSKAQKANDRMNKSGQVNSQQKKRKDLWMNWQEGGICDRAGTIVTFSNKVRRVPSTSRRPTTTTTSKKGKKNDDPSTSRRPTTTTTSKREKKNDDPSTSRRPTTKTTLKRGKKNDDATLSDLFSKCTNLTSNKS